MRCVASTSENCEYDVIATAPAAGADAVGVTVALNRGLDAFKAARSGFELAGIGGGTAELLFEGTSCPDGLLVSLLPNPMDSADTRGRGGGARSARADAAAGTDSTLVCVDARTGSGG